MQTPISSNLLIKVFTALFLALTLAACGGGDDESRLDNFDEDGGGFGEDTPGEEEGEEEEEEETLTLSLGNGVGTAFVEGEIGTDSEGTTLLPGTEVLLQISVIDNTQDQFEEPVDITFSSDCIADGEATLNGEGLNDSNTITAQSGLVEVTYTAGNCLGQDEILATTDHESAVTSRASTTLTVAPPRVGSGAGESFAEGQIGTDIGEDILPNGGETTLTLSVVDPSGTPVRGNSQVTVNSGCVEDGSATLTDQEGAALSFPLSSDNGQFEMVYTSTECLGDDTVTAEVEYEGVDAGTAQTTINNAPAFFGQGVLDDFQAETIGVGIPDDATLSAGGSTSLFMTIVDEQGELLTGDGEVAINSPCLASGKSVLLQDGDEATGPFATNNGYLELTYRAQGCDRGSDPIKAEASYNGAAIGIARTELSVAEESVNNIEFVGAEPDHIYITETGGPETSEVTFRVIGEAGNPISGIEVDFTLMPSGTGDIALNSSSATSGSDGTVQTTVQSGSSATTVRVTATIDAGDAGTVVSQSNLLSVTTGIPDQNSASLSIEVGNPHPVVWSGYRGQGRYDGETVDITIRLADAFNNPVPDGTAVTFTTSGGSIGAADSPQGSCTTENSACTVQWTSQNPYPEPSVGFSISDTPPFAITCDDGDNSRECRPGHVAILATTLGNESFIDLNGNGTYEHDTDIFNADNSSGQCDPSRPFSSADRDQAGCDDLGTAYLDKNFNRVRDSDEEVVVETTDGSSTGNSYQSGDGVYNGLLCSDQSLEAGECTRNFVTVRDEVEMVTVCDTPYLDETTGHLPGQPADVTIGSGGAAEISLLLADCNGNGMAEDTTISVNAGGVENAVVQVSPDELGASADPTILTLSIEDDDPDDTLVPSGSFSIEVASPSPAGGTETTTAETGIN